MAKKKIKIDKHILIPKHVKVSDKEKSQILKKYNSDLKDFPRVVKTDAAVEKLGVKAGDIIKITRSSPTAGEAIFYRVVSNV
tara:strand:- start:1231 stop:1476 length:246 start_codon:yes stop_codon:yes gene_type:complete